MAADRFPATAMIPRLKQLCRRLGPSFRQLTVATAVAVGLCTAVLIEAQENAPAPKDYVIFLGIDLSADPNNELERLPVVGGSNGGVVVLGENGTSVIPRNDAVITATLQPKVSRSEITIERMTGRPVYSPAANPATHELTQMMDLMGVDASRRDAADREAFKTRMAVNAAGAEGEEEGFNQATAEATAAAAEVGDAAASTVLEANQPVGFDEYAGHDGFEVSFRVSTPEPHTDAYGVLQLTIQQPAHPELGKQHAFQVFELPAIGPKSRKVSVSRFRLPRGFQIDSYEVHIYVDDTELATNVSRNRVEVTKTEALKFLILQYVHRNKGASYDPRIAKELRPEWPRPELAREWENITVTLHITPEGTVEQTSVAGGISSPLTGELAAAVREVAFLPALAVGEPVAGSGSFTLGELFLRRDS